MTLPESQREALAVVSSIPRDDEGPVFREPWEAQAFALTVQLHARGAFTWSQWADTLGNEIAAAGPGDAPENYYLHWMAALEKITAERDIVPRDEFLARKDAWDRAARATPHGEPIEFGRETRECHTHK